jgi:hypothetical protein
MLGAAERQRLARLAAHDERPHALAVAHPLERAVAERVAVVEQDADRGDPRAVAGARPERVVADVDAHRGVARLLEREGGR